MLFKAAVAILTFLGLGLTSNDDDLKAGSTVYRTTARQKAASSLKIAERDVRMLKIMIVKSKAGEKSMS